MQICLDRRGISGLKVRNVELRDSISDAISVVAPGRAKGEGTLANTVLEHVTVDGFGLGVRGRHGLWIRQDVAGGLTWIGTPVADVSNESADFKILSSP